MAASKQVRNRSKIKMAGDFDSPGRRQWHQPSNDHLHPPLCQSCVYQEPSPYYAVWTVRRSMYHPTTDQWCVREVPNGTKTAAVHKHSKKNGGTPHNNGVASSPTDSHTAEQPNKQKPRYKSQRYLRSQQRAEEYRKKLESLRSSTANNGQGSLPLKETRDSYTQTLLSAPAKHEDSKGVAEQTETKVVYKGLVDDKLLRARETKLLIAALSQVVRQMSSGEDIRWPRPDTITRNILSSNNLPAPDLTSPEAVVEKVFETYNEEMKFDQQSDQATCACGQGDCGTCVKPCTVTCSYAVHYIFVIFILIIAVGVYLEPTVM